MAWSTPDLSQITQTLQTLLEAAIGASALPNASNIKVLCGSPDTARSDDAYTHLTLYLLHVGRDPHWRNTPTSGTRGLLNSQQPLSLNLSYLLTAWADTDFVQEQAAMSIALRAIHGQPIVKTGGEEFTVSIEADTIEEMSRLWQAFTVPMRLSALLRVAVVFIDPRLPAPAEALPPTTANLAVSPEPRTPPADPATGIRHPLLFAGAGLTFPPVSGGIDPALVTSHAGPLVAVGGADLVVAGNGLDLPEAAEVFLSVPGTATEWRVSPSWRRGAPAAGTIGLAFPHAYADPATALPLPPAAVPPPGLYALTVGRVAPALRSNPIPLAVAPRVDNVTVPPVLTPDMAGLYSIAGAGFTPAKTIVALGTHALAPGAGSPGTFSVNAAGTAITFQPPTAAILPAGTYPVLIQVNGVAAAPGWTVKL